MSTQKLTLYKDDGSSVTVDLQIPDEQGEFNLSFVLDDGQIVNAGNFVVDGNENKYSLHFGLDNGSVVNAGTFVTPATAITPTVLTVNTSGNTDTSAKLNFTLLPSNKPVVVKVGDSQIGEYFFDDDPTASNSRQIDLTLPQGVGTVSIEGGKFYFHTFVFNNSLGLQNGYITNVDFGSNYGEIIGDNAFYNCTKLTGIVISKNVKDIRVNSFYNCPNLTSFVFEKGTKINSIARDTFIATSDNDSISTGSVVCNELDGMSYIGSQDNPYLICTGLVDKTATEVNISRDCTILGFAFLKNCANVTRVVVPKQIKIITEHSFASCTNLAEIVFEEDSNLYLLSGYHHFFKCENLPQISFPDSLQYISDYRDNSIAFATTGPNYIYFGPDSKLKHVIRVAFAKTGQVIHFGKNLEDVVSIFATSATYNVYFSHKDNDPVLFDPVAMMPTTNSKNTITCNFYTDNTTIKNALLSTANEYTIVNVYRYDGSEWEVLV